jgi:hypothetical protein
MTSLAPFGPEKSCGSSSTAAPAATGSAKPCTTFNGLLTDSVVLDYVASKMMPPSLIPKMDRKDAKVLDSVADSKSVVVQSPGASSLVAGIGSGGYKLPTVTVKVPLSVSFASNSSGVAAGTLSVDPTSVTEASSFDTLWSQCRVTGGEFHFVPSSELSSTAGSQFVLAYDPSASTALPSVVSGCQYAQHQLYAVAPTSSGASTLAVSTMHKGESWKFPFVVPHGIKEGTTFGADQWSTSGTSTSYGYVKIYAVGAASQTLISGILYLKLQYRSRQ